MSSPASISFDLSGKVVIVTGGGGFLGRQFCDTLAESGAKTVVADVSPDAAQEVASSIGHDALAVEVDVSDPASVRTLIDKSVNAFGGVDALINGAAVDPKFDPEHEDEHASSFEEYPLEAWQRSLAVNLTGAFLCAQAVARPMSERGGGVIVNIASTYGLVGPDQRLYERPDGPIRHKPVDYSVTKAGLIGLTRYLATYFAGRSIRVNSLSPGGVFNQHDDEFVTRYSARTVLGRMARPNELNGALLFLVSLVPLLGGPAEQQVESRISVEVNGCPTE